MVSLQQSVLILAALAALASSAYAINCYQCESATDDKCGEQFNPEGVRKVDCSKSPMPRFLQNLLSITNATGCMKTINEAAGNKRIIRSCYFGDVKSTSSGCQSDPSLPFVKQISCDVCTDNLCNGSSVTGPIALTIAVFALVARVLY
ncbi:uncharacterized protein LOC129951072 [Eupeodes corollae]|uniref:uncharacterized protein LOC129951072 n=1 Tax=Eupeodes corollae TaxID=290404 RepID=UPI00248FC452|nr:uncharacterized protein LOC129951072 [Eupeodes corollae]